MSIVFTTGVKNAKDDQDFDFLQTAHHVYGLIMNKNLWNTKDKNYAESWHNRINKFQKIKPAIFRIVYLLCQTNTSKYIKRKVHKRLRLNW